MGRSLVLGRSVLVRLNARLEVVLGVVPCRTRWMLFSARMVMLMVPLLVWNTRLGRPAPGLVRVLVFGWCGLRWCRVVFREKVRLRILVVPRL